MSGMAPVVSFAWLWIAAAAAAPCGVITGWLTWKLSRWQPVPVRTPFRLLHTDRTPCPGIRDCEGCLADWFMTGQCYYVKEPVLKAKP